jgi:hypothetical protein
MVLARRVLGRPLHTDLGGDERSEDLHGRERAGCRDRPHDTIVVVPDEEDYAYAKPTKLALPFHIEAKVSKSKWRIKDSRIVIGIAPLHSGSQVGSCCGMLLEFSPYNYAARTEHGASQHIDRDAWWTVEVKRQQHRHAGAQRLPRQAQGARGPGHEPQEIFAQDRMTTLPTDFRYVARVAHKSHDLQEASSSTYWKQSQPIWANINVICQKGRPSRIAVDPTPPPPPTASNDLTVGFQVKPGRPCHHAEAL